jgi:hypothetical protein
MRGCGGAGFQRACLLCGSKQNEVFWWRYGWARTRFHGRWEATSQFACHKCLLRSNHRHVFHVSASGCPVAWLCEFDCPLFPHILNWRQGSWDGWQCGNLVVLLSYVSGKKNASRDGKRTLAVTRPARLSNFSNEANVQARWLCFTLNTCSACESTP